MYPPPSPYGSGPVRNAITAKEAVEYFTQIKDRDNLIRAVTRFVETPDGKALLLDYLRNGPYIPPYIAAVFTQLGLTGDTPRADQGVRTVQYDGAGSPSSPILLLNVEPPPPVLGGLGLGQIGTFRLVNAIGHGGMGTVYEAEDIRLRRRVAVKTLLPELAANPTARERFLREAAAAAAIEHENIVPIFHVGDEGGTPYLVMPLLRGEPLDKHLAKYPNGLPVGEAVRIAKEAATGLSVAHSAGLIHRDIKPANLWLEGEGRRVRVLDFGVVRVRTADGTLTRTGAVIGTPAYMPPEQAGGGEVDHRADIFSLGVVLYELLTGRKPFEGRHAAAVFAAVATGKVPPPHERNPAVPKDLSKFALRMIARNRNDRPATTDEVVRRLTEFHDRLTRHPAAAPRQRVAGAGSRWLRNAAAVAAGVAGLVVVGVGIAYLERERAGRWPWEPDPKSARAEQPEKAAALRRELAAAGAWLGDCIFRLKNGDTLTHTPGAPIPETVTGIQRYVVVRGEGAKPVGGDKWLEPLRHTTDLREIAFLGGHVTRSDLAAFVELPSARTVLKIEFGPMCRTTDAVVQAFADELPGCRVTWHGDELQPRIKD